jgi:hypothetical protein
MTDADTQNALSAVRALATELTTTIDLARELTVLGRAVDLTGLDRQVGLLCAKSLDLPPDEGRRVRPRLLALSGSIEALSRALAARATP